MVVPVISAGWPLAGSTAMQTGGWLAEPKRGDTSAANVGAEINENMATAKRLVV